jgi:hypothetical protein
VSVHETPQHRFLLEQALSPPALLVGGTRYAFTHLEPCSLRVSSLQVGRELRIHVLYSNHCFSRKFDPGLHPRNAPFPDGRGVSDEMRM